MSPSTSAKDEIRKFEHFNVLDSSCVIVRFHGTIDVSCFLDAINQLQQFSVYPESFNRFLDYRNANLAISSNEILAITSWAQSKNYASQIRKVVHLADEDVTFGMLRMLMAHSESFYNGILVTRNEAEARKWVGLSENDSLNPP